MTTASDGDCWDEEVLMDDGPWRLIRFKNDPTGHSFIVHNCLSNLNGWWWHSHGEPCANCEQTPPDGLQALFKLHNWDRLHQKRRKSDARITGITA